MNYQSTLNYLYESAPMFQQIGGKAYKEGLENTRILDTYFGHPHLQYRTIHVGGTNGKGSCSHTLAAILQSAGYRVGLYTSPHLIDFRERIRINGEMISENYVIRFVEQHKLFFESLHLSFFELTTAMALRYFADQKVDIAIIEVGMGGRLDCTNIITPDACIITNISLDHMQFLGDTLDRIAIEKAGIIKKEIPIIIGETQQESQPVFIQKAQLVNAPIVFADKEQLILSAKHTIKGIIYNTADFGQILGELSGYYQINNTNTILSALRILQKSGYHIDKQSVKQGFRSVCELTGLKGRWQTFQGDKRMVCDTGHNVAGISYVIKQLKDLRRESPSADWSARSCPVHIHFVFAMVNDKDVSAVLQLLPKDGFTYYFTRANIERALPEGELKRLANTIGIEGESYVNVVDAVKEAQKKCLPQDVIFVGGSNFIVADLLSNCNTLNLD